MEILVVSATLVAAGIGWKLIPWLDNDTGVNEKPKRSPGYIYYHTVRGKQCRYYVSRKINKKKSKIERHFEWLAETGKDERADRLVADVTAQLAALPLPETGGRRFSEVVARLFAEIVTVYDHGSSHRTYRSNLASFLQRTVIDGERSRHTAFLMQVPEIASNTDLVANPWVLLATYLQQTFDVPTNSVFRCMCGHHASNYWPALRAILLDVPEEDARRVWPPLEFAGGCR